MPHSVLLQRDNNNISWVYIYTLYTHINMSERQLYDRVDSKSLSHVDIYQIY